MLATFDSQRAILLTEPEPEPLTSTAFQPLTAAIAAGTVQLAEPCLVAAIEDHWIVLPMLPMVYHHVAQGVLRGQPWMAAYCCLCNAGTLFDPEVDGQVLQFAAQGFYDVMVLIADQETGSYWNHLTGMCLHGPLAGTALTRKGSLMPMRIMDALAQYPDACLVVGTPLSPEEQTTAERWDAVYRRPAVPQVNAGLLATLAFVDDRLPRHDMGLGIWTTHTQRYYPVQRIYEGQNVLLDTVDGRTVVIVFNAAIGLPQAFYFDTEQVEMRGDELLLAANAIYRDGTLYVDGRPTRPERPHHNAIRWYAFASIFPDCEIYRPD